MPHPSSRGTMFLSLLAASLFGPFGLATAKAAPAEAPAASDRVESSVVKVFSTLRAPDPTKPWTKHAPAEATGSGVVIEGHRILTNAHVVLYASQVQIQAHQAGDKVPASVEFVAPGIDLAVLKLDDEAFFETHRPLERAKALPEVKDAVMAYGYPTGGSNLSITKGIVSRIEFTSYNFPVSGLRIQIDAAINPGNSGGPAVVGERMIGLAFSTLNGAQNIGYIIPNEEIDLFLSDIADGHYDGKPALYDELQTLENPALRAFLKIGKGTSGMVVERPWSGDRKSPLEPWDVITRIGDTPVDDQGMVQLGRDLRVNFAYQVQHVAKDGLVKLGIIRAGKALTLQVPVSSSRPVMVPDLRGAYPSYFVWGPLVFSAASAQFLFAGEHGILSSRMLGSPLVARLIEPPAFPGEEFVIVSSPLLPHRLAQGYDSPQGAVVAAINGVAVKNLRHLVELLRDQHSEFVAVTFARHGGEALVFRRAEVEAATEEILGDNGIRSQGSPELLEVWNARGRR
jgi:S1-C subfamily serine protease